MGSSCVNGREMGGSDSQLTPQKFLSSLKRDAETNGQRANGNIEEINSSTGKVARVLFSAGRENLKNIVLVSNAKTCEKFISYCIKNKYSDPESCFSAIYKNSKNANQGTLSGGPTTTAGMNREMDNNIDAVDKKLNSVYNKLLHEMTPDFQKKLIQSEQDWIKYRDSTVAITAWQEAGGTAQELNQDGEYLELEKNRLKFLSSLLNSN
ncbi:MAG: lysozyme inhibitor LprI family protein [Candidatus Igneacidithiobacillus chanchocoensis]